jgi:hypothetical protein
VQATPVGEGRLRQPPHLAQLAQAVTVVT